MNRYSGADIQEAWRISPRVAKRQAERAIPIIEKEISELKCEMEICRDVMERDLDSLLPQAPRDEKNQQEYARGDEDEEGGVGSQQREPEGAKA